MTGFAFGAPALLLAFLLLPAIWWLLRLTPPRPKAEVFPPLAILAGILKREETPATSPWWLTLLRMALAGFVILGLADLILNPKTDSISASGPLVLLIDNSWSTSPDWDKRLETARSLIDEAESRNTPVAIAFTANAQNDAVAGSATDARAKLTAAKAEALPALRANAVAAIKTGLAGTKPGTIAFISDGIAADDADPTLADLAALQPAELRLVTSKGNSTVAVSSVVNGAENLEVGLTRLTSGTAETVALSARDMQGRSIASGTVSFGPTETVAKGTISAPFELRNDFARITIDGFQTAGATYLMDDGFKRRRVALISGESRDLSQPLLSPLFYIKKALQPFADLIEPKSAEISAAIPELLKQKPSVLIIADIGRLPDEAYKPLNAWIANGGTLLRFAGPRLASAPADDPLVPVILRKGERALGGTMSWSQPQPLADYPQNSPFFGMSTPKDILVKRQVLAEPTADLPNRTWASLADGTPLVTEKDVNGGRIVLFHISAEATWSNLPISGHFVEMLRRVVQLSHAAGASDTEQKAAIYQPYRLLAANGTLTTDIGQTKPLELLKNELPPVGLDHRPGLYGSEDGFVALNLLKDGTLLAPLDPSKAGPVLRISELIGSSTTAMKPYFLGLTLLLLLLDTIIVLFMNGVFARMPWNRLATAAVFLLALTLSHPTPGVADDTKPGDDEIQSRLDTTHLAYVITGENDVDSISERGLEGLTEYVTYRTALEPGAPVGLDITKDELSFYPIIYWPISSTAPMPTAAAISRIDTYMRSGGTVLFDTRDQFTALDTPSSSANAERLQAILADLDIPPLEPVSTTHVLTKSFYLLSTFPGRYSGSPLWIESEEQSKAEGDRPGRSADGVSPILITGNDFAGAWAIDQNGMPLMPTVPPDETQREYAYRTGTNILMYMLTGNYKSDQVHVPALLERLGQ